MFMQVKAKKIGTDEKLIALGVDPKEEEMYWASCYIRSEDVAEFYSFTESKTIIVFYDERPKMLIRETILDLVKKISELEYDTPTE